MQLFCRSSRRRAGQAHFLHKKIGTGSGLDVVSPDGSLDQVILLQVLREGIDEFLGREVLHGEEGLLSLAEHVWLINIIKYYYI